MNFLYPVFALMADLCLWNILFPVWKRILAESFKMKPLVFIVGPTAVGKTDWAIQWARQDSGCILNCDSIQAYRELNTGSAKPDFKKHSSVPFHLFDEISAPQIWTAGNFRRKALEVLKKELPEKAVFAVGGSGFYIQALEKGMYPLQAVPAEINKKLKELQKQKGLDHLYQELKKKDRERAKQISPKDSYRIFRALSLIESKGKSLSQAKKEFKEQKLPWPYLKVGLKISKEELLKRVEKRSKKMIKEGLIEETEALVKKGFRNWKPLSSVGYKEALLYLEGEIQKEELLTEIVSSTMSLAKKQKTWFKKDKNIKWFDFNKEALKVYKELFKC